MICLFNKKSLTGTILALTLVFAVACSSTAKTSETNLNSAKVKNESSTPANISTNTSSSDNNTAKSNQNTSSKVKNGTYTKSNIAATSENSRPVSKNITKNNGNNANSTNKLKDNNKSSEDISEKVKNYILNGQGNKPEAQKIKWSKTFLNRVDIESLYKQYIAKGGHSDNLESFASYMTLNAPIPSNWKDLFTKDLYDTYGQKVVRVEHLKGDLYQAYIANNGSEVPYVVVSSRTGYFHG